MKLPHSILGTAVFTASLALLPACSSSSGERGGEAIGAGQYAAPVYPTSATEPEGTCVRMKINPIGGSLAKVFNDSNHVHLPEARALGLSPINGPRDAWNVTRPVNRIVSCNEYHVDKLTHSVPYLVPEASLLLKEIGHRFNDSLEARGGGNYRLKVTSVLRTEGAVKRLRRRNVNATGESAHRYGTTFDISYAKFICDSTTVLRSQEDLKNLLGEVLKAVRDEGKCYVKYERKQGCFHITARNIPKASPRS